ncbi:MAG: hypothetical protein WBZ42_03580 [Halobacteriota archaeon]
MISKNRLSAPNALSVSTLERELWTSDAERRQTLGGHVKDILMEQQLRCCLERIRWKLGLFEKYGVPNHDRPYVRSLRQSEKALSATLGLEGEERRELLQ